MLLIMYQIFSSLLGHLPFSVHFLLHFYGVTFFGTPNISLTETLIIDAVTYVSTDSLIEPDKADVQCRRNG